MSGRRGCATSARLLVALVVILSGTAGCRPSRDVSSVARESSKSTRASAPPVARDGVPPDLERLGYLAGKLTADAKGVARQHLAFDANTTIYGQFHRQGATAKYSLADSKGAQLALVGFGSNPISSEHFLEGFELPAPPTGTVTLELDAGASAAEIGYVFYFVNGRRLLVSVTPSVLNARGSVQIVSSMLESGTSVLNGSSATFDAVVRLPDGTTRSISLLDDGVHGDGAAGDGVAGATFGGDGTAIEGRYSVVVESQQTVANEIIARTGEGPFVVSATGGAFVGDIRESFLDENQNGLLDLLKFELDVAFTTNGAFRVMVKLQDSAGEEIDIIYRSCPNSQGASSKTVEFSIPGATLRQRGREGPWHLVHIWLIRDDRGSLVVAKLPDYVTRAYPLETLERPDGPQVKSMMRGGGDRFVVVGSGFYDVTSVRIDGQPVPFENYREELIQLTIPAERAQGKVDLTVTTKWGECVLRDAMNEY